jgi:hypothetical protein
VGVMENLSTDVRLARLEEGYNRDTGKGFDEDGAAAAKKQKQPKQPPVVKAKASGPLELSPTRQKKLMLKTGRLGLGAGAGADSAWNMDAAEASAEAAVAPAVAPTTAAMLAPRRNAPAAPRPRGRPRGSLNRKTIVKQAAAAAQANLATAQAKLSTAPTPSLPSIPVPPAVLPKAAPRKSKGGRGRTGTDSMKSYLKDIGSITLLTAAQEAGPHIRPLFSST